MTGAGIAVACSLLAAAPCPDDARVADALSRSTPAEVRARHRWTVSVTADGLKVTLLDAAGAVVRERVVPAPQSCAERETVAAAVLAAWMVATPAAQPTAPAVTPGPAAPVKPPAPAARPEPAPARLVDPPTPAIEPPPRAAEAKPEREELKALASESPTLPPLPPPFAGEPPLPEAPPGSLRVDVSLDARAQLAGTLAPGLGLQVAVGDRLGGFLEVSSAYSRGVSLPPGQVRWFRVAVGLGIRYRFDFTELYVEPSASIEGALIRAEGFGYQQNSVAWGPDVSVCSALKAGRFFSEVFGIYVGARGCAWPLDNRLGVTAVSDDARMPRFEVSALLGVSAGFAVKGSSGPGPSEK